MPNYIRPKVAGATVFFTVGLAERGSNLLVQNVDLLRLAVAFAQSRRRFHIDAWVVLPDHLHAIWTLPQGDHDFSTRWKEIKAEFSKSIALRGPRSWSKISKGESGIWQRRFWDHHIRDATDFETHLHYCWGNPVKHGLVAAAPDWPFSSLHRDMRQGRAPLAWSGKAPEGQFGE